MNNIKNADELQEGNSRAKQEGLKGKYLGRSTAHSLRYCCSTLIKKKSTMVQAIRSGHVGPRESEATNEG